MAVQSTKNDTWYAHDHVEQINDDVKSIESDEMPAALSGPSGADLLLSPEMDQRCLAKLDRWLMPAILITYAFQYTDKVILNGASQFGIVEDLDLYTIDGLDPITNEPVRNLHRFSVATLIFYWGYLAGVLPGAFLAQKLPLGKFLAATVVVWGGVTMLTAVVSSYEGLLVQRFFLGVSEASVGPGFSVMIAMFWKRDEQPLRYSIWYTSTGIGAFIGPMLVYGIGHIKGSVSPWKYQYLILGGITVVWGALMLLVFPDNPQSARFLNTEQKQAAVMRIRSERVSEENKTIKLYQIIEALQDPKTWLMVVSTFCLHFVNGAISGFGAIIVRGFGYSAFTSVLLTGCIGLALLVLLIIGGAASSCFRNIRTYIWTASEILVIIGAVLIWKVDWTSARPAALVGLFLLASFALGYTMLLSLIGSNTGGYTKKVFLMGLSWSVYCISNGVAPLFVKTTEKAEHYPTMVIGTLVTASIALACSIMMRVYLIYANKARDQNDTAVTAGNIAAEDLTDWENPHFLYTL